MKNHARGLLCTGCALAMAQTACAQTSPPPAPTEAPNDAEIVVTAQRRAESLNKVPIAITVVQGGTLRANGATRLSDLQSFAPSLQYTDTPAQPSYQIRGIGTESYDYSVEQAVGIAVDDVNITLPRVNPLNLLADVDHIEVLRGPQGTLLGKNTTAGLISVTTKKPQIGVLSNEAHAQYGSRNEVEAYDILNLPIGDTVAMRLRGGYATSQSPIRNLAGPKVPDRRDYNLNAKLLWQPTSDFSVYLLGDYQNSHGDSGTATIRSYDPAPGTAYAPGKAYGAPYGAPYAGGYGFIQKVLTGYGIVAGPDNRYTAIDAANTRRSQVYGGQMSINYTLPGGGTITSVTAYRREDNTVNLEVDQTPLPVLDTNSTALKAYQLTQELRIASGTGSPFQYVGGLYLYHQHTTVGALQAGTLGLVPAQSPVIMQPNLTGGLDQTTVDTWSYAAFGQATYRVTDRLRVLAGGRVTLDDLHTTYDVAPVAGVCGALYALLTHSATNCQYGGTLATLQIYPITLPSATQYGAISNTGWSGKAGAEYDLAPTVMAYGTASRGYKGAAISTVSGYVFNVRPETVTAWELGIKAQTHDHRWGLTLALFRSDFHDYQAEVFNPSLGVGSFITANAGKLRSQGVEAEFTAHPVAGLSLSGGLTYDDAKFGDYHPPCYSGMTAAQGCDYSTSNPTFNASGQRLTNAPEWSATLAGRYETRLGSRLKGFAGVNWSYRSAVLYQVGDPDTRQGGYPLTDLNVGLADAGDHLRVSVFVRNLMDRRYASKIYSTLFDAGGYSQVLPDNAFRRVGVSLDWTY